MQDFLKPLYTDNKQEKIFKNKFIKDLEIIKAEGSPSFERKHNFEEFLIRNPAVKQKWRTEKKQLDQLLRKHKGWRKNPEVLKNLMIVSPTFYLDYS